MAVDVRPAESLPGGPPEISTLPAVAASEVPFAMEELFFSRTDSRGRILTGNNVFQRVSQYTWQEMTGSPHNIVRHPDMPRAVYYVLWERIRNGQLVGAYVKNRAKDGRHYWVYAVVTPVDDGYLSVRIKPGSALFPAVTRLYATMRGQERDDQAMKPAASAAALLAQLSDEGFRDYPAFMAAALAAETRSRDASLGRPQWAALGCYEELADSAGVLVATAGRMLELISSFRFTPGNLRIQAARVGTEGRAIAAVSANYTRISEEIVACLRQLHDAAGEVYASVNEGLFLACAARLQEETARFFQKELAVKGDARADEAARLLRLTEQFRALAATKFKLIKTHVARFFDLTGDMKRLVSGLAAVRVMGKVESVNILGGIFSDLIGDLEKGQEALSSGLAEIGRLNIRVGETLRQLELNRFHD